MRRALYVVGFTILTASGVLGAPQATGEIVRDMTPALIREAIELGTASKGGGHYLLRPIQPATTMAYFTTPFSRVVAAAGQAKEKYLPFTEADVTPEMIAPEIRIHAPANTAVRGRVVSVESIIIRPRASKELATVVRPTRTEPTDETFTNAMGAARPARSLMAVFPLDALTDTTEVRVLYAEPLCYEGGKMATADCGARLAEPLKKIR